MIEIEIGSDECGSGIESWISIDRKLHVLKIFWFKLSGSFSKNVSFTWPSLYYANTINLIIQFVNGSFIFKVIVMIIETNGKRFSAFYILIISRREHVNFHDYWGTLSSQKRIQSQLNQILMIFIEIKIIVFFTDNCIENSNPFQDMTTCSLLYLLQK